MKNKAWFFGDSFTYGNDMMFMGNKYLKWPKIVSNNMGMTCLNFGEGGIGTQDIINRFIMSMHNISKNDIVVISDTNPIRHLDVVYSSNKASIGTVNTDTLYYYSHANPHTSTFSMENSSLENTKTYIDYIYNFRLNHLDLWESYYRDIIFALKKEMNNRGIEFYYWSSQLWRTKNMFTDISFESNNVKLDMHWGPNGHSNMADYILNRIRNKEYIMESEFKD